MTTAVILSRFYIKNVQPIRVKLLNFHCVDHVCICESKAFDKIHWGFDLRWFGTLSNLDIMGIISQPVMVTATD